MSARWDFVPPSKTPLLPGTFGAPAALRSAAASAVGELGKINSHTRAEPLLGAAVGSSRQRHGVGGTGVELTR